MPEHNSVNEVKNKILEEFENELNLHACPHEKESLKSFLSTALDCVDIGGLTPLHRGVAFCHHDRIGQFVSRLYLADQHLFVCLDHEIRFVAITRAIFDRELSAARFQPFLDGAVIIDEDSKAPFGIGVEFLERVAAFGEPAKDGAPGLR